MCKAHVAAMGSGGILPRKPAVFRGAAGRNKTVAHCKENAKILLPSYTNACATSKKRCIVNLRLIILVIGITIGRKIFFGFSLQYATVLLVRYRSNCFWRKSEILG